MNLPESADNTLIYHDLNSLSNLRGTSKNDDEQLAVVAKHFESIFLKMMLKTMRDTSHLIGEGGLFDSNQQKFYQGMFDDQLALNLSQSNSLGIAELLIAQLSTPGQKTQAVDTRPEGISMQLPPGSSEAEKPMAPEPVEVHKSVPKNTAIPLCKPEDAPLHFIKQAVDSTLSDNAHNNKRRVDTREQEVPDTAVIEKVIGSEFDNGSPLSFIQSLLPKAKEAAKVLGLSPLFLVAQAALETGWGKHIMQAVSGNSSNNMFGIKADKRWGGDVAIKNTLEFEQGMPRQIKAQFRAYDSIAHSFNDYAHFIKNSPRYQEALANRQSAEGYFTNLQKGGYATDPKYAKKIINILNSEAFQSYR